MGWAVLTSFFRAPLRKKEETGGKFSQVRSFLLDLLRFITLPPPKENLGGVNFDPIFEISKIGVVLYPPPNFFGVGKF